MKNMTKSKRRKLDKKKRKEKQERRAARTPSLAYTGSKYRKSKFVTLMLETETAIHEADVLADRNLTDDIVKDALTEMVTRMRRGVAMPTLDELPAEDRQTFDEQDFLMHNIKNHWEWYFEKHPPFGRDALVGILRTILGSIDVWTSTSCDSRGYLEYIEGFLGKAGVSVRQVSPEEIENGIVHRVEELPGQSMHDR